MRAFLRVVLSIGFAFAICGCSSIQRGQRASDAGNWLRPASCPSTLVVDENSDSAKANIRILDPIVIDAPKQLVAAEVHKGSSGVISPLWNSRSPLEYAAVCIYAKSTLLGTDVTDENGRFSVLIPPERRLRAGPTRLHLLVADTRDVANFVTLV